MALAMDPARDVPVPLMPGIRDAADGGFDGLPPLLVIECSTDGLGDEAAPAPRADPRIEALDVRLVERDVHAHGHTLAHR